MLARRNEPGPDRAGRGMAGSGRPGRRRRPAAGGRHRGTSPSGASTPNGPSAEERPNAVGARFFLAVGLLCLLLGAGGLAVSATVEMRARAAELRALRAQGLKRRMVARAGRLSYLLIVIVGVVLGAAAGLLAWVVTGDRLPLVDVLVPGAADAAVAGRVRAAGLGLVRARPDRGGRRAHRAAGPPYPREPVRPHDRPTADRPTAGRPTKGADDDEWSRGRVPPGGAHLPGRGRRRGRAGRRRPVDRPRRDAGAGRAVRAPASRR